MKSSVYFIKNTVIQFVVIVVFVFGIRKKSGEIRLMLPLKMNPVYFRN
jgi:hypothetical protein